VKKFILLIVAVASLADAQTTVKFRSVYTDSVQSFLRGDTLRILSRLRAYYQARFDSTVDFRQGIRYLNTYALSFPAQSGTFLLNGDSTLIRNYSNALYALKGGGGSISDTNRFVMVDKEQAIYGLKIFRDSAEFGDEGNSAGLIRLQDGDSHVGRLRSADLSDSRLWYLPDASGTIALTSSIPAVISDTNRIVTVDKWQTISERKTFEDTIFFGKPGGNVGIWRVSDATPDPFYVTIKPSFEMLTGDSEILIPPGSGTFLLNGDTTAFRTRSDSLYGRKAAVNIWTQTNYFTSLLTAKNGIQIGDDDATYGVLKLFAGSGSGGGYATIQPVPTGWTGDVATFYLPYIITGTPTFATVDGNQTFTAAEWHGTSIDTTYTDAVSKISVGYGILATKNNKDYTVRADSATLRSKFIPYSGANTAVNLGAQTLTTTGAGSFGVLSGTTGTFSSRGEFVDTLWLHGTGRTDGIKLISTGSGNYDIINRNNGRLRLLNGGGNLEFGYNNAQQFYLGSSGIAVGANLFPQTAGTRTIGRSPRAENLEFDSAYIQDIRAHRLLLADAHADASNKVGYVFGEHYLNAEENVFGFAVRSQNNANILFYGGGSSLRNSATEHRWYTAPNYNTVSGTQMMTLTNASLLIDTTLEVGSTYTIFRRSDGNPYLRFFKASRELVELATYSSGVTGTFSIYTGRGTAGAMTMSARFDSLITLGATGEGHVSSTGKVQIKNGLYANATEWYNSRGTLIGKMDSVGAITSSGGLSSFDGTNSGTATIGAGDSVQVTVTGLTTSQVVIATYYGTSATAPAKQVIVGYKRTDGFTIYGDNGATVNYWIAKK
jgi:hypothetical protein